MNAADALTSASAREALTGLHLTASTDPPALDAAATDSAVPLEGLKTVVLAGNPNVGKSVFFNAFTGQYVNVSNFPGTTVDIPHGRAHLAGEDVALQDTPGVYGLSGFSEEETVAEQAILAADAVINVVSALNLERDLFLTQQLIDYGKPLLVALNQMDEAAQRGMRIDVGALSRLLGVPVIPCVAIQGEGVDSVAARLGEARLGAVTPDAPASSQIAELEANPAQRLHLYGLRRQYVNAIVSRVLSLDPGLETTRAQRASRRLGDWLMRPLPGALSLAIALLALYQVVGVWVAGDLVGLTEGTLMLGVVSPLIQQAVGSLFAPSSWPYELLAGEFGVLTMSLQYIVGVLFPLVLAFYVYISLLEDCGYLPRIAVLSDSMLSRLGLNGRAVIPMILGFGCVTMATVSTRALTSQRERTIASTLLAITVPCSAQLAVIMTLMAMAGGLKGWLIYLATLFFIFTLLGTILNRLLPGRSSALMLDLPPMRLPSVQNVARKTWTRTKAFMLEAAPLFVLGSAVVAILQTSGALAWIQQWLAPLTVQALRLPPETARVFVMGLVRRDFGAAGLLTLADHMSAAQILTALIVITLFVPCIASAAIFWKERGIREAAMILGGSWLLAFGAGTILSRLLAFAPL
ncbi:MAG: ferrous iron transport protein B [Vampirovibrionales bacterium]|nr:ferrous iron transport protein B [Vampirovibrionales bacterium]